MRNLKVVNVRASWQVQKQCQEHPKLHQITGAYCALNINLKKGEVAEIKSVATL